MISTYRTLPMQTPENDILDERWDSGFQSTTYNVTDHKNINKDKNYIIQSTLKELNLPHLNHNNKPCKSVDDDAYFEITSAPPDYPSTPSITEDEEEEDDLSTPPLNEILPLEHTIHYESLEEEGPEQYFVSENMYDYHSELSDYYKQLVLNKFDQLTPAVQSTLPETYKNQIDGLR